MVLPHSHCWLVVERRSSEKKRNTVSFVAQRSCTASLATFRSRPGTRCSHTRNVFHSLLANHSFCSFAYFVSEQVEYFLTISEFSLPYTDFFSMVCLSFLNNFVPIVSRPFVVGKRVRSRVYQKI